MNTLLIMPPQWYPMNPYLSLAQLIGQLKAKNYEAEAYDINIEFFNDILTEKKILLYADKAKNFIEEFKLEISENNYTEKLFHTYSSEVKTKLARFQMISEYFTKNPDKPAEVSKNIEEAVSVMKSRDSFYDPEKHFWAKDIIKDALEIVSLPYLPSRILLDNYIANPFYTYNYGDIKKQCCSSELNMFIEYYEEKLSGINFDKYNLIGISICDLSQVVPGLTLAKMIKERCSAHISLGGNYIFKIRNDLKKFPEFFEIFCDSLQIGDGEISLLSLCDHLNEKIDINNVYSLVYKNINGEIVTTDDAPLLNMDKIEFPSFDGYDFSKYFSADIVMPVQLSKGCYWGKCTFCDFYTGQQRFDIKSVERAVDEVEHLIDKYGYRHFAFVDEAIPPIYYEKFADELIKRNIKINFYSFARLEKGFTPEVLQKLYNAGACFFAWGYEAHSPRIMKLLNKGVDVDYRLTLLENAKKIGLWNHCTFLLSYPSETEEETSATKSVICQRDLINSCTPSNFALKKNAILHDMAEEMGIKNIVDNGDFHVSCNYELSGMKTGDIKRNRMEFQMDFLKNTADSMWSLTFTDTDHLMLYLAKYGTEWVYNYKLKYKKRHLQS